MDSSVNQEPPRAPWRHQRRVVDACERILAMPLAPEAEKDIVRSYELHANAYVTKPVDVNQFIAAVRQIDDFFLSVVRLPHQ